ncbi:MAG: ROK family protein [Flavisolibacter sp.]
MNKEILGIDLGGTNIRGGLVDREELSGVISQRVNSKGTEGEVLDDLFCLIDYLITPSTKAIGVGVPGLVNDGIVHDVVNIPSWKEISLQKLIQGRYHLPAAINNDANCFALGEFHFGKGRGYDSMIGLAIGTGMGSGFIIDKKLHPGNNCAAGEFGMIDYLDQCYEYYASGQFFQNIHGIDGSVVFQKAIEGDKKAIEMFEEMGIHLGNAIKTILYAADISLIVLGGSVSKSFPFFSKTMWNRIQTFAFKRTLEHLHIEISELDNSGILGAAALCYDF